MLAKRADPVADRALGVGQLLIEAVVVGGAGGSLLVGVGGHQQWSYPL